MRNKGLFGKKCIRKLSLFMILFLLLSSSPLPEGSGEGLFLWINKGLNAIKEGIGNTLSEVYASDVDYYLTGPGNIEINLSAPSGDKVVDISTNTVTLSLQSKKKGENVFVPVNNATITITRNGENVGFATVDTAAGITNSITIEQRGAGSEQIVGRVNILGGVYNFNFLVKADIVIEKGPKVTPSGTQAGFGELFSTDIAANYLFMPVLNQKYQIALKGYKNLIPSTTLKDYKNTVSFDISSKSGKPENIVTLDPVTNELISVGAGYADIKISSKNDVGNKVKPVDVKLFTPLKFSETNLTTNDYTAFVDNVNKQTFTLTNTTQKTFYTNAFDTSDLEWEVKKNGKKVDNARITSGGVKTANSASSVIVDIPRAGTYTVTAKLKGFTGDFAALELYKVEFTMVVPVVSKDKTVFLNVGDNYNIYENSNIGEIKDYNFVVEGSEGFVSVNNADSVITAIKTGTAVVKVTGPGTSFKITAVVIDTLSLNAYNITIPVGGSFDLTATSTHISTTESWKWTSSAAGVASVEGKGISAVVKGVKPGVAEITIEHTTNSGVTKKASCKVTVTAGVTGIKLIPTEEIVDVGKVVSIRAQVEPNTSQGIFLYWKSSNPKIVEVDNENEHSAVNSVTAKAPGVAVIMALNKDNVVVGTCTITVKTPVSEIKLSEKVLEKTLEEKTHLLTALVLPEGATVTKLRWTSTKPEIAVVDEKGLVTFKKPGNVTIICASESDPKIMDTCDINIIKGVAGLSLDKTEITLAVGETYKLSAEIKPNDASNKNVVFTSLDSKTATVSNTGLISARAPGTAYIMVSTVDKKYNATCTVKVTQKPTGFKLSASSLVLDVGEGYTLEATFNPKTVTETKIVWTTSDASVAKVDVKGRVVGVSAGQCIITATTANGLLATCHVKVNQQVSSISLSREEAEIEIGEELELEVIFNSDDVTNKDVKWKSSNSSIAKVNKKGVVTGMKGGIAVITVTSDENGMTATAIITVNEQVTELSLNKTSLILGYKQKFTLVAEIKNKSATKKKIKWSSSKNSVVSVNKKGVIYGKKPGTATIKAAATDGSGAEATCIVRVVRPATSLSVDKNFISMVVGKTSRLKTKIGPKTATIKTPKYKSENTDVAIVDNKGKITAIGAGKTRIIVSTKDSSKLKQVVVVQARDYIPSSGITLSTTNLTLGVGDKQSVIYSLSPNGTDDKVTWSSNNKAAVRVSKKGVISAMAPGSSVITATTTSGRSATVSVTVVGLNFYSLELEQYDSYKLSVLGDIKNVSWDTSNNSIATVVDGNVVAKKAGNCNIYARVNGALLTCRVRVKNIR